MHGHGLRLFNGEGGYLISKSRRAFLNSRAVGGGVM